MRLKMDEAGTTSTKCKVDNNVCKNQLFQELKDGQTHKVLHRQTYRLQDDLTDLFSFFTKQSTLKMCKDFVRIASF